ARRGKRPGSGPLPRRVPQISRRCEWTSPSGAPTSSQRAGPNSNSRAHRPSDASRGETGASSGGVGSGLAADEIDEVPERNADVGQVEAPRRAENRVLEPHPLIARLADVGDLQPRRAVPRLALCAVEARVSDPGCRSRWRRPGDGADRTGDRSRATVRVECAEASPGATGLTHNTSRPVPSPVRALTPPPTRPNTLFEGGGWSKEEYAMTQPVWPRRRHARMCWKSPPESRPAATVTLPPRSTADTSRRRSFGFGSISELRSCVSIPAPCEWPMNTTPRPLLSWAR